MKKDYVPSTTLILRALLDSASRLQDAHGKGKSMFMFISPEMAIALEFSGIDFNYNISSGLTGFSCAAKCLN